MPERAFFLKGTIDQVLEARADGAHPLHGRGPHPGGLGLQGRGRDGLDAARRSARSACWPGTSRCSRASSRPSCASTARSRRSSATRRPRATCRCRARAACSCSSRRRIEPARLDAAELRSASRPRAHALEAADEGSEQAARAQRRPAPRRGVPGDRPGRSVGRRSARCRAPRRPLLSERECSARRSSQQRPPRRRVRRRCVAATALAVARRRRRLGRAAALAALLQLGRLGRDRRRGRFAPGPPLHRPSPRRGCSRRRPATPGSGRSRRSGSVSAATRRARGRSSRSAPRPTAARTASSSTTPGMSSSRARPVTIKAVRISARRRDHGARSTSAPTASRSRSPT